MDCPTAQDAILEALTIGQLEMHADLRAHLATCADCARFAARQQALDARLSTALVAPHLSPSFRPALGARIRRERRRAWLEVAPDVVHFTSCALATAVCAWLVPASMAVIVGAGITAALATYVAMAMMREALENAD